MAKVIFKGISKFFGKKGILEDFSLEVFDQEFLVLVGPSGCGKSTTLRLLAGLESASAGDIFIGDRSVSKVDPKDRDIAMVFQNYALYPHYSVYENLAFSLKIKKVPMEEIKKRVLKIATLLNIHELLERRPKALSGGQRQRVALGRAIIRNPKVFLMDEPLSNLDAKLRVQMRAELVKLQKELKTTTLYVTHDQVEAMTMGHRIVVLNEGKIQQIGTPEAIYHNPANLFVAGFMGAPPMNFVEKKGVMLGARPEHILIGLHGNPCELQAEFILVEPLGAEYLYHFDVEGKRWIVRSPKKVDLQDGQQVTLSIPESSIYCFEAKDSGNRLRKRWSEAA